MRIVLNSRGLFGFAGLWDVWKSPAGDNLFSFTILTTEPIETVRFIHNRMPVILPLDKEQWWLSSDWSDYPRSQIPELLSQIESIPDLTAYPVSILVNSPKNDSPACIEEVPA
jgi:putative SOS response-associated peptidase YedK